MSEKEDLYGGLGLMITSIVLFVAIIVLWTDGALWLRSGVGLVLIFFALAGLGGILTYKKGDTDE